MSLTCLYCETPRQLDRSVIDDLFGSIAGYVKIRQFRRHQSGTGYFYVLETRSETAAARVINAFNYDPGMFEPMTKIKLDRFSGDPPLLRRQAEMEERANESRGRSPAPSPTSSAAAFAPAPPPSPVVGYEDVVRQRVLANAQAVHKLFFAASAPSAPVPLLELTVRDVGGKTLHQMHVAEPLYKARIRPLCDAITRESFLCFDGEPPFVLAPGQAPPSSAPQ